MKPVKTKDYELRAFVVYQLIKEGISVEDIRHELTLDTASSGGRVDIAVLRPNQIWAIEIKSGSDVLDRLEEQIRGYRRAFDRVLVVADKIQVFKNEYLSTRVLYCGERKQFVQSWGKDWKAYEPGAVLRRELEVKWGGHNTSHVDMLSLLWREEAARVACGLGFISNCSRCSIISMLKEEAKLREIRPLVIDQLRKRQLSKWEVSFWTKYYEGTVEFDKTFKNGLPVTRFKNVLI